MEVTRSRLRPGVLTKEFSNIGEEGRDILTALEADEEIDILEEEEVAIIDKIADKLERRQEDKLLLLEIYQR